MARMTVPEAWDTGTDAAGPATAIASTATPAMVNHTPPSRARRPGPCPGLAVATPAEARAAARRRATATAAHARPAATSRPTARRAGLARLMRACAGRWVLATTSMSAVARSASVPMRWMGTPARRIPAARRASRPSTPGAEPGAKQRVAGVDDELLPGLGVFDDDQADVGQLVIGGVDDAQGDDLVPWHQAQQRPPPVAVADEVGDDHDQGAAPGELGDRVEHRREVGRDCRGDRLPGGRRRRSRRARRRCAARACAQYPAARCGRPRCRKAGRRPGSRPGRTAGRAPGQAR